MDGFIVSCPASSSRFQHQSRFTSHRPSSRSMPAAWTRVSIRMLRPARRTAPMIHHRVTRQELVRARSGKFLG